MNHTTQPSSLRAMLAIVTLLTLISGCTSSVHPLFTDADLSQDLDLTGKWQLTQPESLGDSNTITLQQFAENRHYDVTLSSGEQKHDYLQLGKLAGQRFLQIRGSQGEGDSPLASGLPVYTFVKIEVNGDELKCYQLDDARFLAFLQQQKIAHLIHKPPGGSDWTVLTIPTAELQRLVTQHSAEMFTENPIVWRRIRASD